MFHFRVSPVVFHPLTCCYFAGVGHFPLPPDIPGNWGQSRPSLEMSAIERRPTAGVEALPNWETVERRDRDRNRMDPAQQQQQQQQQPRRNVSSGHVLFSTLLLLLCSLFALVVYSSRGPRDLRLRCQSQNKHAVTKTYSVLTLLSATLLLLRLLPLPCIYISALVA